MRCKNCGSEKIYKNGKRPGTDIQKYKCSDCGSEANPIMDGEIPEKQKLLKPNEKGKKYGITASELRAKHDVDYIVLQTLEKLEKNRYYEKDEVRQMTGLRAGYPGLSTALEACKDYYGKADGKVYYGHPESINEMKSQAILT